MSRNENASQCAQIRKHLEQYGSLTPIEALDKFGCFRLGARIFELKEAGMPIITERCETASGAVIARYVLRRCAILSEPEQIALLA